MIRISIILASLLLVVLSTYQSSTKFRTKLIQNKNIEIVNTKILEKSSNNLFKIGIIFSI